MTQPSTLYRLAEAGLDEALTDFIATRRPHTSWREIAEELAAKSGVTVHEETLRLWFAGRITVETTVRVA